MDGAVEKSLDAGSADRSARRLLQFANSSWAQDAVRDGREARSRRCAVNLATLRAPLDGVDLDSRDHAMLTWLADHDVEVVAGVRSLLDRARAAHPLRESDSL
ncbi:hypothetical protein MOQ72_30460 [Saccharopolyspora sp. K220]|uniref:hypothetical protein n=1 Tax=Saccharopolyspora soli TaxID=2926618 RepID=UPI001F57BD3F|nr:hypothetical protein [Saccharopolyspora soli]MCI2421766.1 hypothetical protein [Saccharopolyspora soli]